MGRNHEIRVKVSQDELKTIERKSNSIGMKPSTYLRWLGLTARYSVKTQE